MSFYFTLLYCLLVNVVLYPCILCVALLMCVLCLACLTVFVNCLEKQFAICLGVVIILLLNLIEVFSVCGSGSWIDRVWSYTECVYCDCDRCVHLSVPSIGFVYVFVCRKLFLHL